MMERPIPYKGNDGYIFVSYAHKDARRVWPIIAALQQEGYRIWYDEGIDPGTEWDENIAAHVTQCGCFVAMLTENYLASDNCKDELKFSRDLNKPQVLVYLEDVPLPPAMALRIGRSPGIRPPETDSLHSTVAALAATKALAPFRGKHTAPLPKKAPSLGRWLLPILLAVLTLGVAAWMYLGGVSTRPQETIENRQLADTGQMTVTLLGSAWDENGFSLRLSAVNNSNETLILSSGSICCNGALCSPDNGIITSPGETVVGELYWSAAALADFGLTPKDISVLEGSLWAEDTEVFFSYYPYGQENAHYVDYTPKQGETVLMDTDMFLVSTTGLMTSGTDTYWMMYLQNHTDAPVEASVYTTNIYGKNSSARLLTLTPNEVLYTTMFLEGTDNSPKTATVEFQNEAHETLAIVSIPYNELPMQ